MIGVSGGVVDGQEVKVVSARSKPTWRSYCHSIGDRSSLFAAVADGWGVRSALYLGSYLDLAPSTAIASVTYVDIDKRAAAFFADREVLESELEGRRRPGAGEWIEFVHQDYTDPVPLQEGSFDLMVSLFTSPAWDSCRRYLAPDGLLLANASHGEASLAALDSSLRLAAAIHHEDDTFHFDTKDLDSYLIPKNANHASAERIRRDGKGVKYTRDAFAYLFLRV